jgi:N-acetylmuramoyl-L-alanine amidase
VVTRRNLLVGSAAVLGAFGMGTGTAAATVERSRRLSFATALPSGAVGGFALPGGLICPVPFMSRAAWGADESWRFTNGGEDWPAEHHPAQALTVHHTGFAASSDPAETVRTIYRQQALTPSRGGIQGWGDIGYNLLIDAAGVVYEGRHSGSAFPVFGPTERLMTTGAHVLYYNTGNIGVCLLGYLNDVPPTQAAQDSLVTVLAYLAAVVGVNPLGMVNYYNPVARPDGSHSTATVLGVSGHRNWTATDCPGNALYPMLGQIRQRVAAAMPSAPEPSQTQGSSQPTPSASPQPEGSSQPTPPASQNPPQPVGSNQPTPQPSQGPPQPGGTGTPSAGSGGGSAGSASERGGDEYVAAARSASPSQFPTATPPPTSTVESVASAVPSSRVTPTLTSPPAIPEARTADSPSWGVTATAVGLTVAGAVGGWWWRRQRPASSPSMPSDTERSIVDELTTGQSPVDVPLAGQPTVDAPTTGQPPADEPTTQQSPPDQPTTGEATVDEPTTGQSAVDEPTTGQPAADEPGE